jgi:hypothetical protein
MEFPYTDREIRFLLAPTQVENSIGGNRTLTEAIDLRQIGCPTSLFAKVCERRAKKLGAKFAEFRSNNQITVPSSKSVELELAAAKLF